MFPACDLRGNHGSCRQTQDRRAGGGILLDRFLEELEAEVIPATRETASIALDAFARYGKGRHPAKLNFGDCFSYAGARSANVALLYVGSDFTQTDLA